MADDDRGGGTATKTSKEDQFRDEQRAEAAAQGTTGENAVPEQRPIASQRTDGTNGTVTSALDEQGVNLAGKKDSEPMGKDAHDKAAKRAEKGDYSDDERQEALKIADVVTITDKHPVKALHGQNATITRVIAYKSVEDQALANAGVPESRFVQPKEVEVSTRGGDGELSNFPIEVKYLEKITMREFRVNG